MARVISELMTGNNGDKSFYVWNMHNGETPVVTVSEMDNGGNVIYRVKDYEKKSNSKDFSDRTAAEVYFGMLAMKYFGALTAGFVAED